MPGSLHVALPSKRPLTTNLSKLFLTDPTTHRPRLVRTALLAALLLALFFVAAGQVWAAVPVKARSMVAAKTTTTQLQVSSATVNQHSITVLSATVTDPATVTQGLVNFYDGKTLLGSGQIVNTGTKYTHGKAYLKTQLGPGTHVLKAVFAGTAADAASASSTQTAAVSGSTVTSISSSGSAGNYTLMGQVLTYGPSPATGTVSFLDDSNNNASLGSAPLGAGVLSANYLAAQSYGIYDPADNNTPMQVVVADFNGDGILDFAEVDYSASISIHLGKGDGSFQAAEPFCTSGGAACQAGSEPISIVVGDFNSDGIPDLAINDGSDVLVFLGNGDGTFQQGVPYATASGNYTIAVGDFNRDGTPDFAVAVDGGVSIVLGNGDGTFQPNNDIPLNYSSTEVTLGDFNKDGIQDLALTEWNGSNIMVLLGNGDGSFKAEKDTLIASNQNPANGTIMAADFKGAGYLCDLAFSGNDATFEPWLGKGDGTFIAPNGTNTYPADKGFSPYAGPLTVADLNGDGIPDVALLWYTADNVAGRVAVFYGKGDGTFNTTPTQLSVGKEPVWVATGDFDGNGSPDLVVANENDSTLSVILNRPTTTVSGSLSNVAIPGTGTHNIYASYLGGGPFLGSSSTTIPLTAGGAVQAPTISSISPNTLPAGSAAFTLTVNGANFATGAAVKWNGSARTTVFVSATKLSANIAAADIAKAGSYPVTVTISGATSNAVNFTVTAPLVPVISSLSPASATAGGAAFTLTVKGSNFAQGSTVNWNGAAKTTTYVSATQLSAAILATDIASAGTYKVTVVNSTGATSPAVNFTVTAPVVAPELTSISPNDMPAEGPAFTLTVNGTGFLKGTSGSVIYWNTTALPTTFVSTTSLTAAVPAAKIAGAGSATITVKNGSGPASNAITFTITPEAYAPIAMGFFDKNGNPGATSGNITCTWEASPKDYWCTLSKSGFYFSKYVVNVTIADVSNPNPAIATVNSIGGSAGNPDAGNIVVKFFNLSGAGVQEPFYICVYKP
jgi:hypothetical protein